MLTAARLCFRTFIQELFAIRSCYIKYLPGLVALSFILIHVQFSEITVDFVCIYIHSTALKTQKMPTLSIDAYATSTQKVLTPLVRYFTRQVGRPTSSRNFTLVLDHFSLVKTSGRVNFSKSHLSGNLPLATTVLCFLMVDQDTVRSFIFAGDLVSRVHFNYLAS